jgi:hypothetical protein
MPDEQIADLLIRDIPEFGRDDPLEKILIERV